MVPATCSCGFTEAPGETLNDHLQEAFEPPDLTGNDGRVHEERDGLTCACGLAADSIAALDAHFLSVFTPGDAIGLDGRRHEAVDGA
jgi:hypothetical protein